MRTNKLLFASMAALLLYALYVIWNNTGNSFTNLKGDESHSPERLFDVADSLISLNELDRAIALLEKAESIFIQSEMENSDAYAKNLHLKAYALQSQRNFDLAISTLRKSISIRESMTSPPKSSIAKSYHNIGSCLFSQQQYTSALQNHQIASKIWLQQGKETLPYLAISYSNQSSCLGQMGDYKNAIVHLEKAMILYEDSLIGTPVSKAIVYDNLGIWTRCAGDWKAAIAYHEKALNILDTLSQNDGIVLQKSNVYNNLAMCYELRGDDEKTLSYYEKALRLRQKEMKYKKMLQIAISLENIGMYHIDHGGQDSAIQYLEQALAIRRANNDGDTLASFQHLCYSFDKKEELDTAQKYCEMALDLQLKKVDKNADIVGVSFSYVADVYFKQGEYNRALNNYKKAYNIWSDLHDDKHYYLASVSIAIGNCYRKDHNLKKAYTWYFKALEHNNYSAATFETTLSTPYLIQTFQEIAATHWEEYQNKKSIASLQSAYQNYMKAEEIILFQRNTLGERSEKKLLNQLSHSTQEGSIKTALKLSTLKDSLKYLAHAFSSAEAAKSRSLFEALRQVEALKFAGIPDSLLEKEKNFRYDIAYIQKQLLKFDKQKDIDNKTIHYLQDQLFQLKEDWENLILTFQKQFPDYYKLKFNLKSSTVKEVQQNILAADQTLLEFFTGDSTIFLFLLQQNHFQVHEIKRDFPLEDWVRELTKEGIYGFHAIPPGKREAGLEKRTVANYTRVAQQLYNKLIAPVADKLTTELIIIPDGVLGYVPFEALLSATPPRDGAFKDYPFLVKKHQISYCYSATLLREMQQKQHLKKPVQQLLAMAPFFQEDVDEMIARIDTSDYLASASLRDSLGVLEGSGEEIARINKLWKGTAVYGTDASLAAFQQTSTDYQILHLSTHGKADDRVGDYAYLAFGVAGKKGAFDKLYARDLYNYSLNADMVVLSACETGIGKLQKGEGIISLARAFAYAGAKSIFNTLWKVDDVKTKDLMVYFYTNLKKRQTKDAALRNAKLEYLDINKGNGEALHPFFWAGMIGIGDMGAIYQ